MARVFMSDTISDNQRTISKIPILFLPITEALISFQLCYNSQ